MKGQGLPSVQNKLVLLQSKKKPALSTGKNASKGPEKPEEAQYRVLPRP
jgi:hypothetical protein